MTGRHGSRSRQGSIHLVFGLGASYLPCWSSCCSTVAGCYSGQR